MKIIDKDILTRRYHTFDHRIDEEVYEKINKSYNRKKTVEIEYFNTKSAEIIERMIDVYYKDRRYVIGYCHIRKAIRKFRTSRIISAKITDKNYSIPGDFDKNKFTNL